jgi:hypothetical protein
MDIRRATIKARLVCGVYILQSTRVKYNQYPVDAICPSRDMESEDFSHFALCLYITSLHDARQNQIEILSKLCPLSLSTILDSCMYVPLNVSEDSERQRQTLAYRLHEARIKNMVSLTYRTTIKGAD